jgi:hypothetical protein
MVFDRYYSFDGNTGLYKGAWLPNEDALWQVDRVLGSYVKVQRVHAYSDTTQWVRADRVLPVPNDHMGRAMRKVRQAVEYKVSAELEAAKRKAADDTYALSRNTVTRALVHAADNGYCNETVIALVSAGHKMPEATATIRVTVDIPIEVDGKEDYYIMRSLFGATRGDFSKIVGSSIPSTDSGYETLESKLGEKLGQIGADVDWRTWQNATITELDVRFPMPVIRPIEDVQTAPAAHYQGRDEY